MFDVLSSSFSLQPNFLISLFVWVLGFVFLVLHLLLSWLFIFFTMGHAPATEMAVTFCTTEQKTQLDV